ncbi:head-tail connector protein [Erythrobacter rubeus]|uniref:Phage head-tail connector protein n=1 Tax=Erythrobacter rubeus TaxID=2760803 RepID=A0ABR8KUF9_9SPHN|nr:head-tail connector protein [Erythrobacter rubeus]MBD2842703.1 phage head-tail connector protein [Erythrobacter rubeus]
MRFELAPLDLPAVYGESVVSLADLKVHLRVTHDDEDALIEIYRDAAVDMVERYCGVRLGEVTGVEWRAERLDDVLDLGVWPVTGLTSIVYLDSNAGDQTGEIADWRILQRGRIALKPSKSSPSDVAAGVVITFDAGFGDDNRPAALVQAVKLFAAHLYMNREAVGAMQSGEVPLAFRTLCGAYRMPQI